MIRKAPSPVPFEGGLECRPEDRAAPALVIEPTGRRFAPPCPSPPRVDCCRDARARASGTRRALAGAPTPLRRRLSWRSTRWLRPKGDEGLHSSAIPKRAGRSCRRGQATRHAPRTRTRVPRRAFITASGPASRRDNRRSRAGSCGRASRLRRISQGAGTDGISNRRALRAAPA